MNKVYAFKNTKEELLKSSSGGAFIAICYALEKKFKNEIAFYGVSYDKDMNVVHQRVETALECHIFQGSKYVKSNHTIVLKDIEKDIKKEKYILFSGTPCQIFAVKNYLKVKKIDYDKIYYIDIICHGTPQVKFWNDYKNWLEQKNKSKLIEYSFRYKPEGWKAYPAYAEFENGNQMINTPETSIYSKLHMKGYITNKGCFSCAFSNMKREGDITLGDYWGIEEIEPEFYDKNGVSLVISNTKKGNELIKSINGAAIIETKTKDYLKYQHNLFKNTDMPKDYDNFWKDYESLSFDKILKKYLGYSKIYKIKFCIKKFVRKTFLINYIRKLKKR